MTDNPTTKELINSFPDMEANSNCLQDIACPFCGNREAFRIEMTSIIKLYDAGTEQHEDTQWDADSYCRCCQCDTEGVVRDFTFTDLDKQLKDRHEQPETDIASGSLGMVGSQPS